MRRHYIFILSIIALFTLNKTLGQTAYYSGNLLRISFNCTKINPADTLGSWNDRENRNSGTYYTFYKKYFDHITTPRKNYFLIKSEVSFNNLNTDYNSGSQELEYEDTHISREIAFLPDYWCATRQPYMPTRPAITETKNGVWLTTGIYGNAFLANNDSLFLYDVFHSGRWDQPLSDYMRAILGNLNNSYLAAFKDKNTSNHFLYYLINPDLSPIIDSLKSVKVNFFGDSTLLYNPRYYYYPNNVTRIRKLSGNLYAISTDQGRGLSIYSFSDSSFFLIKNVLIDEQNYYSPSAPSWDVRNNKLILMNNTNIASYDYNSSDTSFVNRSILLNGFSYYSSYSMNGISGNFGIDRNMKYAAVISKGPENLYQDTLKIFDIDKADFINTIVLNNIKGPFLPVVDSPYVYIHQINYQYTGVDDIPSVIHDYSLAAYPNPFNPSTTISYSIPKESHVELKVHDMLGREVSTLVNQKQVPGEYKVQFNASSLSSGVYIYSIHAGDYRAGKKLLFLK